MLLQLVTIVSTLHTWNFGFYSQIKCIYIYSTPKQSLYVLLHLSTHGTFFSFNHNVYFVIDARMKIPKKRTNLDGASGKSNCRDWYRLSPLSSSIPNAQAQISNDQELKNNNFRFSPSPSTRYQDMHYSQIIAIGLSCIIYKSLYSTLEKLNDNDTLLLEELSIRRLCWLASSANVPSLTDCCPVPHE